MVRAGSSRQVRFSDKKTACGFPDGAQLSHHSVPSSVCGTALTAALQLAECMNREPHSVLPPETSLAPQRESVSSVEPSVQAGDSSTTQ